MLPIVDKPLIQYAVEECLASGIDHIIFVTGRNKIAIEDHFDLAPELDALLEERGKSDQAKLVRELHGEAHFSYTRQREALGLGHAVLCAASIVGDEPFAVLLPDVIMAGGPVAATRSLIDVYEATGAGAIDVEEVPREKVHMYGIVDAKPANDSRWGDRLLRVTDLVEKPTAEKAPSNLAVSGRYVLPAETFEYLLKTKPGAGGEIQLTDALRQLAARRQNDGLHLRREDLRRGRQAGFPAGERRIRAQASEAGNGFPRIPARIEAVGSCKNCGLSFRGRGLPEESAFLRMLQRADLSLRSG